jgi:hypothetical protein
VMIRPKDSAPRESGRPELEAKDAGEQVYKADVVITFPPGAVEEVVKALKAGKITMQDAKKAVADLALPAVEDVTERILEEAEQEVLQGGQQQ